MIWVGKDLRDHLVPPLPWARTSFSSPGCPSLTQHLKPTNEFSVTANQTEYERLPGNVFLMGVHFQNTGL